MKRFYSYLKSGSTKVDALRLTQIDFIVKDLEFDLNGEKRIIDASAPFFWAAFQLNGVW
jgi:CHAT domain-containing protein